MGAIEEGTWEVSVMSSAEGIKYLGGSIRNGSAVPPMMPREVAQNKVYVAECGQQLRESGQPVEYAVEAIASSTGGGISPDSIRIYNS